MRQINADIDTYRREFLKLMLEQEIDALVCPSMVSLDIYQTFASKEFNTLTTARFLPVFACETSRA